LDSIILDLPIRVRHTEELTESKMSLLERQKELQGSDPTASASTIYGPVLSWRIGWSLGVDLIQEISTCSFNCIYCQLGEIQVKTTERKIYIPTERVLNDLQGVDWSKVDIVTVSGSGEPTLALNLGEVLREIRRVYQKPTAVLTNALHLDDPAVRADLAEADEVAVKLDAATDDTLHKMNRPARERTIRQIVDGILQFKQMYAGKLSTQTMLMGANYKEVEAIAHLLREIQPQEIQLNTPKRFYPLIWRQENRGRHTGTPPEYPHRQLKTITPEQMAEAKAMVERITGIKCITA